MAAPSTIVRGIFSRALPANATAEYEVETDTQLTNVALDGDKPGRTVVKLRYLDFEKAMQSVPGYVDEDDSDFDEDGEDDSEIEGEIDMAEGSELSEALKKAVEVNGANGTNEVIEASDVSDDSDLDSDNGMVETKEVILCSLTSGGVEQFNCNLLLPSNTVCEFIVTGPNAVHLLGHFVEQYDPAHDDYDEDGYGESDDESIDSEEMGLYDPEDADAPLHEMGMADAAMLAAGSDDDDEDEDASDLMDEDADRFAEVADADIAAIEAERRARAALLKPSPSPAKKAAAALPKADKPAPAAAASKPAPAAAAPKPAATAAGDVSLDGLSKNQRKKALKKLKAEGAAPAAAAPAAPAPKATAAPAAAAAAAKPAAAANGKKPSKKQTLDNGLVIEDHKSGDGAAAANGKRVGVRYIGKLQNGKVFDSNTKGAPFTFRLGKGEVIKGWDVGIAGMQVGGERKLTIPASLAYGKAGTDGIPGNATLTFDVKLLSVK